MASRGPAFTTVLWLSPPTITTQASPATPPSITQPPGPRVSPSPRPTDPRAPRRGRWDTRTRITPWDSEVVARATETCLTRSRTLYLTTAPPPVTPAPAALPVVPVMQTRHGGANNATLPLRYASALVWRLQSSGLRWSGTRLTFFFVSVSIQGLQKGPGSHSAGPNGEPPFSSSPQTSFSSSGILNQVGHSSGPCTASSSASSLSPTSPQTTPNHLSSPPHSTTTSGVHTKDTTPSGGKNGSGGAAAALPSGPEAAVRHSGGTPLSPGTEPAQGLTNHVQPRATDGSGGLSQPGSPTPGVLSSDNPQLSALLKGKANATSNDDNNNHSNHGGSSSERINNVHPGLHGAAKPVSEHSVAASSPLSATATPSPRSADPHATNSLSCLNSPSNTDSQGPTLNGKGPEDSQSPLKVEPSHKRTAPAGLAPWSSVSIYPSSSEVLKACR